MNEHHHIHIPRNNQWRGKEKFEIIERAHTVWQRVFIIFQFHYQIQVHTPFDWAVGEIWQKLQIVMRKSEQFRKLILQVVRF
jgi:hypothetical protein